jgi:hypothetical protein
LNHGAVSSTVQLEIHTPKDAGCDARRDKGFHFEILASRNDRREFDS